MNIYSPNNTQYPTIVIKVLQKLFTHPDIVKWEGSLNFVIQSGKLCGRTKIKRDTEPKDRTMER